MTEHGVPSSSVLHEFAKDDVYRKFLDPNFDGSAFTSSVIKSGSVPRSMDKISEGIRGLNNELNSQVVAHHEELLVQVNNIKDLEIILDVFKSGVDGLQDSINRIKVDITEPYLQIKSRTLQLERLQSACELLRKILRFLFVSSQLRKHLSGSSRELPKAAQCLHELELIRREEDLVGIEVIENESSFFQEAHENVTKTAIKTLTQGMDTLNQAEVANALQVFYNMEKLEGVVNQTITQVTEKLHQTISQALSSIMHDYETKGSSLSSSANTESEFSHSSIRLRNNFWSKMEKMVESLNSPCVKIWHLQRVLLKMRHPTTHQSLLDVLVKPGTPTLTKVFWTNFTTILSEQLADCAKRCVPIENAFVGEYPKLLRLFLDFVTYLQSHFEIKQSQNTLMSDEQRELISSFSKFETAYLGRCLSRLCEPINHLFPPSGRYTVTAEDLLNLTKIISMEVEAASVDENLLVNVIKGVARAVKLFAVRAETMVATDSEAFQVTEPVCTQSQQKNSNLFNSLQLLHSFMKEQLHRVPSSGQEILRESMNLLQRHAEDIINPIFTKFRSVVERTLLGIHNENYASEGHYDEQDESKYLKLLQVQIYNLQSIIMAPYAPNSPWIIEHDKQLVIFILMRFLRHASVIRYSESGKLRITADMAQLELALTPLYQVRSLGMPYKVLRALRPLLFQEISKINGSMEEVKILPPSCVLNHLFSRATSPLLIPPHTFKGLTISQYISWLQEHSEEQIWSLMKDCLDSYSNTITQRGERHFDPIYPIICSLGPTLVSNYRS